MVKAAFINRLRSLFQPKVEWQYDSAAGSTGVPQTPVVAPLFDTNGDGQVDDRDVPAVIFILDFGQKQANPKRSRGEKVS